MKDIAEETAGTGKGKEVSREVVPMLESTPPRTGSPNSSPDEEISTLPFDNHIDGFGQLVEDTTQNLSSSTQLGTLSDSASQISMDAQHVDDYPMTGELDEAKDSDQGVQGNSTLISQENNTPDQPALQSEHSSDSDVTDSEAEEETIFELTKTVPDTPGNPHCGISVQCSENESTLPPAIRKTRITPEPVSIEEVEDEDFRPGAHPNCETVGIMTDEYGDLDGCSDEDTTGSPGYGDDDSDEDDFSSSELSPENWRTTPAPLWREVERTRNSPRIVDVNDFGADGSGKKSGRLHRESFGSNINVTNSVSRPESPSGVAESSGAHTKGVYTLTPQPHERPASSHSPDTEQRAMYTLEDIVEQFGFDPFRNDLWRIRGISEAAEQSLTRSSKISSSYAPSSISESEADISRLSPMSPSRTMELNAAALQQIPEDPDLVLYGSRVTLSTREVRSRSIGGNTRKPRRPSPKYSEWQEESARRDWNFPRRSASGLRGVHEYSGPDEPRVYAVQGAEWEIDQIAGRTTRLKVQLSHQGIPVQPIIKHQVQTTNQSRRLIDMDHPQEEKREELRSHLSQSGQSPQIVRAFSTSRAKPLLTLFRPNGFGNRQSSIDQRSCQLGLRHERLSGICSALAKKIRWI